MASFSTYYALLALVLVLVAPAASGKQFTIADKLLLETNMFPVIQKHLETSTEGLTAFAPTDVAFGKLPPGDLDRLTLAQKTQFVRSHMVPKYYSFANLSRVSFPLQTFAQGKTLKVGLRQNMPVVSSGLVTTPVAFAVQDKYPVSVFAINDVLIPPKTLG
ncbi:fasciclin-like arabinogalactan protein 6 [Wolffia australiana]